LTIVTTARPEGYCCFVQLAGISTK